MQDIWGIVKDCISVLCQQIPSLRAVRGAIGTSYEKLMHSAVQAGEVFVEAWFGSEDKSAARPVAQQGTDPAKAEIAKEEAKEEPELSDHDESFESFVDVSLKTAFVLPLPLGDVV